ncbi:MAG TPA: hypothetical protein VGP25_08775 [Gemmatimonadaceae bacterium]|nr:hypothetical protein [Gemmatimonadaceae bacterium]
MTQRLVIQLPMEQAYRRRGLFALELLDGATLSRVSEGVKVTAHGLRRPASVNASGLFVWREERLDDLTSISIEPRTVPFLSREVDRAELRLPPLSNPITAIELVPRVDYDFPAGITGMRGTLVEDRVAPLVPVTDAELHLLWLDEDSTTWHDAATRSRTNARGDFVSFLRLAATDVPQVDATGALTVRLRARRGAVDERSSLDVMLVQGRVADPTTLDAKTFAWDELQT